VTVEATELRLGLAARAENLALVRQALAGFGDAVAIAEGPLADLKQIASEACMNAVLHAYPGEEQGRIDVVAALTDGMVVLQVRDWGVGFRPRPAEPEGSLRLGLPLIATVADSFEIASPADGGTALIARVRLAETNGNGDVRHRPAVPRQAEMAITAGSSARPVIARVLAIAATWAGFSLERMSDGVLLGDAIAAGEASDFAESRVGISLEECGPNLCVRVGPLVKGGAQRMLNRMELPGLGVSITKLANRVEVETDEAGEYLMIEIEPQS
jgi:anti-sigma regulatory factor (Ser/Thr protein kinase)